MKTETVESFCTNHPGRTTSLRCNKCGKPFCIQCLERTPVGYRCKECIRRQQQAFENIRWYDYVIVALCSAILSGFSGLLLLTPALCSAFIISPVVGGLIAEASVRVVNRRRGRYLQWVSVGGTTVGALFLSVLLVILVAIVYYLDISRDLALWVIPSVPILHAGLCMFGLWYRFKQIKGQ